MTILPCPFCGSSEVEYADLTFCYEYEGHTILCRNCEAHGPIVYVDYDSIPHYPLEQWKLREAVCKIKAEEYRQVAIEKWNNRKV